MRQAGATFLVLATLLSLVSTARAGGLELFPGGTRALGRGGAIAARVEDPMVVLHNPAGLAHLEGQQLLLNIDTSFADMCFQPYGYYGWGVVETGASEFGDTGDFDSDYSRDRLDEVCNSAEVIPLSFIAWSWRITENLGVGIGFVAPTVVAGQQWGGEDGTIQTPDGGRPTPTRYQMVKQEVTFALPPSFGVGYRVHPRLSLGLAFQWTAVIVESTVVQTLKAGTSPHDDMLVKLTAEDFFLPSVRLAVHAKPMDALDLVLAFRWVDDFDGSGEVDYETSTYTVGAESGLIPFANEPIEVFNVKAGLPWALTLGVRYADLLLPLGEGKPDPMLTERWDIEFDAAYTFNEMAGDANLRSGAGLIRFRDADPDTANRTEPLEVPTAEFDIDRHLKDAIALRLGGSYNPLPGVLNLQAGVNFETEGVQLDYANIDTFAFQRYGFGLGVVLRVSDVDLMLAYGHIFQETVEIAPPPHENYEGWQEQDHSEDPQRYFDKRIGDEIVEDPTAPSPGSADGVASLQQPAALQSVAPARVVNAGKFTSSFDVLSLGVNYRF